VDLKYIKDDLSFLLRQTDHKMATIKGQNCVAVATSLNQNGSNIAFVTFTHGDEEYLRDVPQNLRLQILQNDIKSEKKYQKLITKMKSLDDEIQSIISDFELLMKNDKPEPGETYSEIENLFEVFESSCRAFIHFINNSTDLLEELETRVKDK
jgi:hypothetical protein